MWPPGACIRSMLSPSSLCRLSHSVATVHGVMERSCMLMSCLTLTHRHTMRATYKGGERSALPCMQGRRRCMRRADSAPAAACKVHVLDLSELAASVGAPRCSEEDFVVDPLDGLVVPHPRFLGKQALQKPADGADWMYPYQYSAHSQSHWAGPWCAAALLEDRCCMLVETWLHELCDFG